MGAFDRFRRLRDCDGRPLKKGDKVVIVRTSSHRALIGEVLTVIGRNTNPRYPVAMHLGGWRYNTEEMCIRKVIPPTKGDWSEVTKSTGWSPEKSKAKPRERA